tara:strand:- start:575 stop:1195 length:621 start_codon:yes stop_codon:yes gene_type:complete
MRWEIILFLFAGFLMANVYSDGRYFNKLLSYKKYYHMAGILFGACVVYWLLKKDPKRASTLIQHSNEYLKYLPVDKNTSSIISPILDFTSKNPYLNNLPQGATGATAAGHGYSMLDMFRKDAPTDHQLNRLMNSGKKATKRSVSETKKKFVASNQNWKCGDCGEQLSAWYEIDHKVRLEYGGSNEVNNLVALCRECHGKKTTIENL